MKKKKKKGGRGCAIALGLLLLASPVLAEEYENPVGVGADLVLWTNESHKLKPELSNESRWDFNNREFTNYTVVKLDVFNWLKQDSD